MTPALTICKRRFCFCYKMKVFLRYLENLLIEFRLLVAYNAYLKYLQTVVGIFALYIAY